jgi:flagellar biosynthesis/type III secretory pathway chaperone
VDKDDQQEVDNEKEVIDDARIKKLQRIEKEKQELLASLAAADFTTLKARVASILNLYPATRNSDVSLALQYWATFQPDLYKEAGILPKDLFKLERLHYLVRARAKIQNEYGLFQADDKVKRHRRKLEEKMEAEVIQDAAPRKVVHVYADETGKTQKYVLVASVWVLAGRAVFSITQAINEWRTTSGWGIRELHFAKFGRQDMDALRQYLEVILANREFLSFKVIAVEKARTKRPIEEVVEKLHEHMLVRGAAHEIESNRIDLPRDIAVTIDEEQSLDSFVIADLKRRVADRYQHDHDGQFLLTDIQTTSSRNSALVQLADLIAGAVNRYLNHEGERNYKDDMADLVVKMLDIDLSEDGVPGLDASALFRV